MELVPFLRQLIDLDSTTGQEAAAVEFVAEALRRSAAFDAVELWEAEPGRCNVFARRGAPQVVLSTHIDTVPPYFASSEDEAFVYGRGACDAKGILAAQLFAALTLARRGVVNFGLLFLVGEEKNSAGARAANQRPQGTRYLVNGEPTESRMIVAGKGVLRLDLVARGRLAHSAYPELGDSAIDKLLEALARVRALPLPRESRLGACSLNIGTLAGGQAPNVIADFARAELMFRLVGPAAPLHRAVDAAVTGLVELVPVLELAPIFPKVLPGFPTATVAFGTDIPNLDNWGEPLLFGPGSIEVAHTCSERIAKAELRQAAEAYAGMVATLLAM